MVQDLQTASLVLALLSTVMLVVLVVRRFILSSIERRHARLEVHLRPLALDVLDGEVGGLGGLTRSESRTLAVIVQRYSQQLTGEARENLASFFEGRGDVEREIERLQSLRTWRRATAAYLLGDMASPAAVSALVLALDDRKREVRSAAARSLGLLGAQQAVPRLVECLAAGAVPRGVAGFALLNIGVAARGPLRSLLTHADADVRSAAAELLGYVGSATDAPALTELLGDPSADVRAAAAKALGRVGDDAANEALRVALQDRMPFVRTAAAWSLAELDDIDATELLAEQARTDEYGPAQAAARALAAISPQEAIEYGSAPEAGPHLRQAAGLAKLNR